jgi:hypothetical protein
MRRDPGSKFVCCSRFIVMVVAPDDADSARPVVGGQKPFTNAATARCNLTAPDHEPRLRRDDPGRVVVAHLVYGVVPALVYQALT